MTTAPAMNPDTQVGQFVAQNPATARIFERLGLDYCCGGRISLAEACSAKGLPLDTVIRQLIAVAPSDAERRWDESTMTELADHIEAVHHAWLRTELPRIAGLIEKVCRAHGDHIHSLHEVQRMFLLLGEELLTHMATEERVLFPALRAIEGGDTTPAPEVADPALIARMIVDHDDAGAALASLRALTNGYTPPDDACNTYRVMLHALQTLERDMHQHVHKENNILFPLALRRMRVSTAE